MNFFEKLTAVDNEIQKEEARLRELVGPEAEKILVCLAKLLQEKDALLKKHARWNMAKTVIITFVVGTITKEGIDRYFSQEQRIERGAIENHPIEQEEHIMTSKPTRETERSDLRADSSDSGDLPKQKHDAWQSQREIDMWWKSRDVMDNYGFEVPRSFGELLEELDLDGVVDLLDKGNIPMDAVQEGKRYIFFDRKGRKVIIEDNTDSKGSVLGKSISIEDTEGDIIAQMRLTMNDENLVFDIENNERNGHGEDLSSMRVHEDGTVAGQSRLRLFFDDKEQFIAFDSYVNENPKGLEVIESQNIQDVVQRISPLKGENGKRLGYSLVGNSEEGYSGPLSYLGEKIWKSRQREEVIVKFPYLSVHPLPFDEEKGDLYEISSSGKKATLQYNPSSQDHGIGSYKYIEGDIESLPPASIISEVLMNKFPHNF